LQESGRWQANRVPIELDLPSYGSRWRALADLSSALIWNALLGLGVLAQLGLQQTTSELLSRCGIESRFARLVERWLERMTREGRLAAGAPYVQTAIEPMLEQANGAFGADRIFLDYVLSCGRSLPRILKGEMSALETLFPGGEFALAEKLYQDAPLSAYMGGLSRAVMEAIVRARPEGTLRVLEIGAGTGSTTSGLLPVLPPGRTIYEFTDLSEVFLAHGRRKFAHFPFVRYRLFDAEQPVAERHCYDVIVATNVLHATHDIRATIANVKDALAPGGLLLLTEATAYLSWYDVTTALIEGWQLFEDGLRGDHPLLPADRWTSLLIESGFEKVMAFPEAGAPTEILGQHVIVAQAPGQAVARHELIDDAGLAGLVRGDSESPSGVAEEWRLLPASERQQKLVALVRQKLAGALRTAEPESLDPRRKLVEFGVDSLMAIDFRNRLSEALQLATPLRATLVYEYPTIESLAEFLDTLIVPKNSFTESAGAALEEERAKELQEMSDADAEALLLKRLQSL
jgi:SAM-dependent methyltransferase